MEDLFNGAHAFNQDISAWTTSLVTVMEDMFMAAHAFNQDISKFDTSKVTTMAGMFYKARHAPGNKHGCDAVRHPGV